MKCLVENYSPKAIAEGFLTSHGFGSCFLYYGDPRWGGEEGAGGGCPGEKHQSQCPVYRVR